MAPLVAEHILLVAAMVLLVAEHTWLVEVLPLEAEHILLVEVLPLAVVQPVADYKQLRALAQLEAEHTWPAVPTSDYVVVAEVVGSSTAAFGQHYNLSSSHLDKTELEQIVVVPLALVVFHT